MSRSNPRVLSTLERAGGFASAQEIYRLMQREGESIGLTTVYRSLQSLVSDKIVDVLRRDDGEAIYRLCGDAHHHHLVCKGCGDTVEIEDGILRVERMDGRRVDRVRFSPTPLPESEVTKND